MNLNLNEKGEVLSVGPYILTRYIQIYAALLGMRGSVDDILKYYICDENLLELCKKTTWSINTPQERGNTPTKVCKNPNHSGLTKYTKTLDYREKNMCTECYENEVELFKLSWPELTKLQHFIRDNEIIKNIKRDFIKNGKMWYHILWWIITCNELSNRDVKKIKHISPNNTWCCVLYNYSKFVRSRIARRVLYEEEICTNLSMSSKYSSLKTVVRELEYRGYTNRSNILVPLGKSSHYTLTKKRYVWNDYIKFLNVLYISKSVFIMCNKNDNTIVKSGKDGNVVGPAELLTLRELTRALKNNWTVKGNITLCYNGTRILETDYIQRGQFFAEAWTIAKYNSSVEISLTPPGLDITDKEEYKNPWPDKGLDKNVYNDIGIVFEFDLENDDDRSSKKARTD